jgi:uncharacterized membrane protein YraQ (UPF0718 family)/copper chaperone CopZ
VDSVLVTYALLGPVFTIFRPLAALLTGVVGGYLVDVFDRGSASAEIPPCSDSCCTGPERRGGLLVRALRYGFVTLPADIGRAMLLGLLVAGLISVLVPEGFVSENLGSGVGTMLLMMLFSIPLYVCATASVPIAAALIAKGVSPGAVLVFLMAGPATNAAAIATIWKFLGRRASILYLATVAGSALALGLLLDRVFVVSGVDQLHAHHAAGASWIGTLGGIVLLGLLLSATIHGLLPVRGKSAQPDAAGAAGGESRTLVVKGMTCHHCAEHVCEALSHCRGVRSASVDLRHGTATVRGDGLDAERLADAVESLGYRVVTG